MKISYQCNNDISLIYPVLDQFPNILLQQLYERGYHLTTFKWGKQGVNKQYKNRQQEMELVARCLSGSQDAWTSLYRYLYRTIHFIAHWRKWGFSPKQAEEMMQESFASLITSLKTFKFDCSLETFAAGIAEKKCISELRKSSAVKRRTDRESISIYETDDDDLAKIILADPQPPFEEILEQEETEKTLLKAFDTMGEKCRTIIYLKYYEDHSYEEIADFLNLPIGTVASRLKRCLIELRNSYEKCCGV